MEKESLISIIPSLEGVQEMFDKVTDQDLKRVLWKMRPSQKGEETLGTVHRLEAQKLWVVSEQLDKLTSEFLVKAKFEAGSEEESDMFSQEALRLHNMHDIVWEIFWTTAKDDIGGKVWRAESLVLRADWMVVAAKPVKKKVPSFLPKFLGSFSVEKDEEEDDD